MHIFSRDVGNLKAAIYFKQITIGWEAVMSVQSRFWPNAWKHRRYMQTWWIYE